MIVIQYKKGIVISENNNIVDLFDTAKEFKEYIKSYLEEMDEGMEKDGLEVDKAKREVMSFESLLDEYLNINDELEIKIV